MSQRPGRTAPCPTDAELAAFSEGGLERDRREEVARHALRCPECMDVIATIAHHRETTGQTIGVPLRWVALAASVLLAVAVGWAGLTWWRSRAPDPEPWIAALVEAAGATRLVEARLSGGFAWAAVSATRGLGDLTSRGERLEIAGVAARIRKEAGEDQAMDSAHALGVAHLLLGNVEEAIARLDAAAEDAPKNPAILSDLAAALIERGKRPDHVQDLARGLDAAERALALAPDQAEARFNKALAVEELGLREAAVTAWEHYLQVDADSSWAREVRARLERLRNVPQGRRWADDEEPFTRACAAGEVDRAAGIMRAHPQAAYEAMLWDWLPGWADRQLAGDVAGASTALASLRSGSRAAQEVLGDPVLARAVNQLAALPAGAQELGAIATGCRQLKAGHRALDELSPGEAAELLRASAAALESSRSAIALVALLQQMTCRFYMNAATDEELDALVARADAAPAPVLGAKARWLKGLSRLVSGRASQALPALQQAAEQLEDLGFRADAVFVRALVASTWRSLGQSARAWSEDTSVYHRLDDITDPRRTQALLSASATQTEMEGLRFAAVALQEAALQFSERHRSLVDRCEGQVWLARVAARAEDVPRALRALGQAEATLRAVPAAARPERPEAELRLVRAGLLVARDPRLARQEVDRAATYFRRAQAMSRLVEAYLTRARSDEALGELEQAEEDYLAALSWIEKERASILDPALRLSFYETAFDLARELVRFHWSQGHRALALQLADRVRARTLLELQGASGQRVGTLETIQSRLAPSHAILFFASLPDRTIAWVVRTRNVDAVEIPWGERELERRVLAWRDATEEADGRRAALEAARLFDGLIRPAAAYLPDVRLVTVIPDGPLHRVAWASLRDSTTGRIWAATTAVAVAPCMSAVREATPAGDPLRRVLAVGNPRFDRSLFGDLPDLPGAEREAEEVAASYAEARVLRGDAATADRVLEAARWADVLHIAAHAVVDAADGERSALILAPGGRIAPDGALRAKDLRGRDLTQLRVVVLAACRSGDGPLSRAEGPLSLARPFLEAGVGAVVVSLFDLPDEKSAAALVHRHLREVADPVEAVRRATVSCWEQMPGDLRACGSLQVITNVQGGNI